MINKNITYARNNLFELTESCIKNNDIAKITTKSGIIVMMSEEYYNGLKETLYLCSIPGMKESIIEGMKTPSEELEKLNIDEL